MDERKKHDAGVQTDESVYVLPSSESESDRLERQAGLYGGPDFLSLALAEVPGEVLDVGCGTGYFSRHVAKTLPDSRVTAVDMDAKRLDYAHARASDCRNIRYVKADMMHLPLEDGSFDLVFSRFVLVHMPDPETALREMARVTRPGGRVVAYDMVHDGIWFSPEKPAFAKVLKSAIQVMQQRGMEPSQGLHLGPAMVRAGLKDVEARVVPHCAMATEPLFEAYRRNWVETIAGLSEILGAAFDKDLINRAVSELEKHDPAVFLVELTVSAQGTKGAA